MTAIRFIDRPTALQRHLYDEALDGIIHRNKSLNGLKAIYKFGNITSPGISDLDILFVFENSVVTEATGLEDLPLEHTSLFTHGIMAVSEEHFAENNYFTLWSDHTLIWGTETISSVKQRTAQEESHLKIQTAIEFLIANYIDLKIQKSYKVIKLRALLQHMKGILYDLDFLDDKNSTLHPFLNKLKSWSQNWFNYTPGDQELSEWLDTFEPVYDEYVQNALIKHPMFLPQRDRYKIAKNMTLTPGVNVSYSRIGFLLPTFLSGFGRKYVKLQHRFNQFHFTCPITHSASPIVGERFDFLKRMKDYNRKHLPNFMTITTSITAKLI